MTFTGFSVPELNVLPLGGLVFQEIAGRVTNAVYCSENSYGETEIIACV